MEKHSLCDSCILEIVTALETAPIFEAVNAFGPTIVMIFGLFCIERNRATAQKKQAEEMAEQQRLDQNKLRRGYLFGFKEAMKDIERQRENQ